MRKAAIDTVIDGVILVAGLVSIVGESVEGSWRGVVTVVATVGVFWAARVYADTISHLGDPAGVDAPLRARISQAFHAATTHAGGMLLGAALPLSVLLLGLGPLLDDRQTVWGVLWLSVVLLGILGYAKVASWTPNPWARLASGAATAALGLVLVLLKVLLQ